MQITGIDPRDVTMEVGQLAYRVYFSADNRSDEFQLADVASVSEVLHWAAVESAGRSYEVYVVVPMPDGVTMVTLHREPANDRSGPVEQQVSAYNAHDLDRFAACYADDVVIMSADGTTMVEGIEQLREQYAATFARRPYAEIRDRVTVGDWTVDHEVVAMGERHREVLVGYRTESGRITRVLMLG